MPIPHTPRVALMTLSLLLATTATYPAIAQASSPSDTTTTATADLRAAAAAADPAVRAVYERNGFHLLWTDDSAAALREALAQRADNGLDRRDFGDPEAESDVAARDVARTHVALGYARALAMGIVDPADLHEVYTLPRPRVDLAAGLQTALRANKLGEWLASLAPQDLEYRRLSAAYLDERSKAGTATADAIEDRGTIHPGDRDPRLARIGEQLVANGYLAQRPATMVRYTPAMAEAVRHLQRDYGIAADGVVGPATLGVLNTSPADRERALAVGLERRRWLDRNPAATRIDVNVAAAQLTYYRDGQPVDRRKAIVGKPGRETPLLAAPIFRLVANPTWTVPKSIQNTELANVGAGYLRAHNMVMKGGWIVQQPGPENALGQVKFDMRDDQAIYLHDTATPALFDRSERHLSHGCVRVEDALGFADRLAEEEGVDAAWQEARASGEPTFVPLPREIPVRLLYQNVFVTPDDQVAFRTDPYGWNEAVAVKLGFTPKSAPKAQGGAVDIGP